jgi:pyruvate kinase
MAVEKSNRVVASRRRTKIVCTIGPATASPDILKSIIAAGADCLRFNFSHGQAQDQLETMLRARRMARKCGRHIAIMVDLCGPKIRTGPAPVGGIKLKTGSNLEIAAGNLESNSGLIGVNYSRLVSEVKPGQRILMADGRIELVVKSRKKGRVQTLVKVGGLLGSHKGVNLPGARLSTPAMTAKDKSDLTIAAAGEPDFVALSFVRGPADLDVCRRAMKKLGLNETGLIAKIEKPEALECIPGILEKCQGIMVARGDLGVEMSPEDVPGIQRKLVEQAARNDRLCIVATEMFESMISSVRPTRAEVSDVAGAVREGADAVMLSAETSIGRYPVKAVRAMSRVLLASERSLAVSGNLATPASFDVRGGVTDILCVGAKLISGEVGGGVLVASTESGKTALYLSKSRPGSLILGVSPAQSALRKMALYWGVTPVYCRPYRHHAHLINAAERLAVKRGGARPGQYVIIISGTPLGASGLTNTLHLRCVKSR